MAKATHSFYVLIRLSTIPTKHLTTHILFSHKCRSKIAYKNQTASNADGSSTDSLAHLPKPKPWLVQALQRTVSFS